MSPIAFRTAFFLDNFDEVKLRASEVPLMREREPPTETRAWWTDAAVTMSTKGMIEGKRVVSFFHDNRRRWASRGSEIHRCNRSLLQVTNDAIGYALLS